MWSNIINYRARGKARSLGPSALLACAFTSKHFSIVARSQNQSLKLRDRQFNAAPWKRFMRKYTATEINDRTIHPFRSILRKSLLHQIKIVIRALLIRIVKFCAFRNACDFEAEILKNINAVRSIQQDDI